MDDAKTVGDGDSEDEMDDDFVAQLMGEGDGSFEEDDEQASTSLAKCRIAIFSRIERTESTMV